MTSENTSNGDIVTKAEGPPTAQSEKFDENRGGETTNELGPFDIAENHGSRSRYMQLMLQANVHLSQDISRVPSRTLVQFWDDSNAVPADVRECLESWRSLDNQGFERLLFDDWSAKQFIEEHFSHDHVTAFKRCKHPAMRSDYFRLCFLLIKGGFYADADDVYQGADLRPFFQDGNLKLQPLCYAISSDSMVNVAEFLKNPYDSPDLIFYVNNNPLIAPPDHPVIRRALERSTQIFLTQADDPRDVQSTTGPGNLTASLVRHAIESERAGVPLDVVLLPGWDKMAVSQWPLEYRKDARNWRLWDGRNV